MLADKGHTAVNPWEPTVTAEQVERCHDAGLLVNAWTCNDPARFLDLAAAASTASAPTSPTSCAPPWTRAE